MQNKKTRIFSIVLSVLVSIMLVVGIVSAATTLSENIATGGTLTVTGATTLNGSVTLGDAAADTITVNGKVGTITLANSETIDNTTNGTITATGKLVVAATRLTDGTGAGTSDFLERFIDVDVDLTGIGTLTAKGNTYLLSLAGWRSDNVVNDQGQDDVGLKISMDNHATGNATSYILRGMDVKARNKHTASVVGRLEGAYITAENEDGNTSAAVSSIVGVYANAKNGNSTNFVGNVIGLKVENQSSSTTGTNYGLVIALSSEAQSMAKNSAIAIQGSGTDGSWNYGLDMNGAVINTAAIRLQNATTISSGTTNPTAACVLGSLFLNTTTAKLYVCTVVTPTWTVVGAQVAD